MPGYNVRKESPFLSAIHISLSLNLNLNLNLLYVSVILQLSPVVGVGHVQHGDAKGYRPPHHSVTVLEEVVVTTDCHLCTDTLPHSDEGDAEDGRLCLMVYKGGNGGTRGRREEDRRGERRRGGKKTGVRSVDITM